jgi:hypothetical protein
MSIELFRVLGGQAESIERVVDTGSVECGRSVERTKSSVDAAGLLLCLFGTGAFGFRGQ